MTAHAGKDGIVRAGATPTIVGEVKSWTIDEAADALETSTINAGGNRLYVGGMQGWSGTLEAFWDEEDAGQAELILGATIDLELEPTGTAIGNYTFEGQAVITGISDSAAFDGLIERNITFQGTGALTRTPQA